MKLSDLSVEVRDKNLKRVGVIPLGWLNIVMSVMDNNVGKWTINLAREHPMSEALQVPGSGIVVTLYGETILSGPMIDWNFTASSNDPKGTFVFDGVSDDIVFDDRLIYPVPTTDDLTQQGQGSYEATGPAESLLHTLVNANCGPSAPASRQVAMTMGADGGNGGTQTVKSRFGKLGKEMNEIALLGDVHFQLIQRDDKLVFETWPTNDLTKTIRLDVRNNTLAQQKLMVSAPGTTRAIVNGSLPKPDQTSQTGAGFVYVEVTSADSLQAELDWGRRIETYVSKGNETDTAKLTQDGNDQLAKDGFTLVSANVTPMDGATMRYGIDWKAGDRVAVVVDDQELSAIATGLAIKADENGFVASINIGDPAGFDMQSILRKRVTEVSQRLAALERE